MSYSIEAYHGLYNIVRRSAAVRYIVVHYVGDGTSAAGSARRNCVYFAGGDRQASAHYFIDDGHIFEFADPREYATWHVGDGHGRYGITNANSIGIEVCNNGGPYTEAEIDRLTWLVQRLMGEFGVPAERVVRHYDASRKMCPLYYAQNPDAWSKLHSRITGGAVAGGSAPAAPAQLVVDGYWGKQTTLRLQELLGCPYKDGVISYQWAGDAWRHEACTSFQHDGSGLGSVTIQRMQQRIGVKADGLCGKDTINALIQRYKSVSGATVLDGKLDAASVTVKAMQRALNDGRL